MLCAVGATFCADGLNSLVWPLKKRAIGFHYLCVRKVFKRLVCLYFDERSRVTD